MTERTGEIFMTYHTSNEEHAIDIVNVASLETKVRDRMEKGAFGYIRGVLKMNGPCEKIRDPFNRKKYIPEF